MPRRRRFAALSLPGLTLPVAVGTLAGVLPGAAVPAGAVAAQAAPRSSAAARAGGQAGVQGGVQAGVEPKSPVRGLSTRARLPKDAFATVVAGMVINQDWANIQPSADGPLHLEKIDKVLTKARDRGVQVRLRIQAGGEAPAWAKALGGPPVRIANPAGGTMTVGRFWTPAFGAAYQRLMNALGARYDADRAVREVAVTRCSTVFPEPFIRQPGATMRTLYQAGYTATADKACIRDSVTETAQAFPHTNVTMAFNPYPTMSPTGDADWHNAPNAFTFEVMDWARATYGRRFVVANYSVKSKNITGDGAYQQMYRHIREVGPPISLQTAVPRNIGDLSDVLRYSVGLGANSVELPDNYAHLPVDVLRPVNAALQANTL